VVFYAVEAAVGVCWSSPPMLLPKRWWWKTTPAQSSMPCMEPQFPRRTGCGCCLWGFVLDELDPSISPQISETPSPMTGL